MERSEYKFLLYYHYCFIEDPRAHCVAQEKICSDLSLSGRIRVSDEGINGMLGGDLNSIVQYMAYMDSIPELYPPNAKKIHWKLSGFVDRFDEESQKLRNLSVKVTKEVVSLDLTPSVREAVKATPGGAHLSPEEFHLALKELSSSDTEFQLLDIRNDYEVKIGTFEVPRSDGSVLTAMNPETRAFSDTAQFLDHHIDQFIGKKVFMYCTGGVRCERASSYLRYKGVEEIYQLFGGVQNYQATFADKGYFRGKNFVFDPRIALPSHEVAAASTGMTAAASTGMTAAALPSNEVAAASTGMTAAASTGMTAAASTGMTAAASTGMTAAATSAASEQEPHSNNQFSAVDVTSGAEETCADSAPAADVIGACLLCACAYDDYAPQCRCSHCRMLVLVCDTCRQQRITDTTQSPITCQICLKRKVGK